MHASLTSIFPVTVADMRTVPIPLEQFILLKATCHLQPSTLSGEEWASYNLMPSLRNMANVSMYCTPKA